MKAKNTIRESKSDWDKLRKMKDSEIDFSDIPKLDQSFFPHAALRIPKRKKSISLRLDADVLEWFKQSGKGYQTRINALLRSYVQAHQQ